MALATLFLLLSLHLLGHTQSGSQSSPAANQATANPAGSQSQAADADAAAARKAAIAIVVRIQRADYEGDRPALDKLYDELVPFVDDPAMASRIRYWRGFAKWRRAINGFNETPTPADLAADLTEAESEFDAAIERDPSFVDAKIAAASCIGFREFQSGVMRNVKDYARMMEIYAPATKLLSEAKAAAPDNPRLLWVLGPNQWNVPPASTSQPKAIEMYERGLKDARAQKNDAADPLEPSWGEPELLMNLAWSNLHRTTPDLVAAENYAQDALKLVPYWHYVRDILLPQIRQAKAKAN
jgi:tetratricopeptide (TPR) repeat protein